MKHIFSTAHHDDDPRKLPYVPQTLLHCRYCVVGKSALSVKPTTADCQAPRLHLNIRFRSRRALIWLEKSWKEGPADMEDQSARYYPSRWQWARNLARRSLSALREANNESRFNDGLPSETCGGGAPALARQNRRDEELGGRRRGGKIRDGQGMEALLSI
ncbi:hypothetical protein MIND_01148100 [Mycena indigotica]|uniref:Uncharacterized protein n=1 Tax=Mycena indigotica TaxID=2126181 RepID=A0A8H6S7S8_9AGAR|nr:uncharacterized protein MIND_01148100 [Mycena indigotica]KAF7293681.1 hypothetical protein MIND_01148100 [Mycena indigotica]